jgi:RNA polymerase sigma-70 factor (ECF subfamily)
VLELTADQLLRRIREHDHKLIAELRQIIDRIARKFNWTDSESADDIAQDCFIKLIESLTKGRFEGRSSFKTYIYTIVRRTCIDYYKSHKAAEMTDIDQVAVEDSACSQEDQVMAQQQRKTAYRVLMSLPKECRNLWRAVFYGKRNYRQVAEQLGLSEGTIKRRMWQCRQQAREKVEFFEK